MSTKTSHAETGEGRNAFAGRSSEAPPKFVEFGGVRGYAYAAQALLRLAEGCPDNTTAAIFIVGAAITDTIRYSGFTKKKPSSHDSE